MITLKMPGQVKEVKPDGWAELTHEQREKRQIIELSSASKYWRELAYSKYGHKSNNYDLDEPEIRAPGYISDIMEPTRHMVNGKMYDSKSKFREATKDAGCIEIGNETKYLTSPRKPIELSRAQRVDDIKRAIYQAKNGQR